MAEADGMPQASYATPATGQDAMWWNVDVAMGPVKSLVQLVKEKEVGTVTHVMEAVNVPIATVKAISPAKRVEVRVPAENARVQATSNVRLATVKGRVTIAKAKSRLPVLNAKVRAISKPIHNTV